MKKQLGKSVWLLLIAVLVLAVQQQRNSSTSPQEFSPYNPSLATAFAERISDLQVEGEGRVVRLLRDDLEGSRHQRFILDVGMGHTVLISHNIDLAPRVPNLLVGDQVGFYGEYEWNAQGGVIHWTHHDPAGRHVDGWLRHEGQIYQ